MVKVNLNSAWIYVPDDHYSSNLDRVVDCEAPIWQIKGIDE